jgi:hypothetical protein
MVFKDSKDKAVIVDVVGFIELTLKNLIIVDQVNFCKETKRRQK